MHKFKITTPKGTYEYSVRVTVGTIERVKAEYNGLDLSKCLDNEFEGLKDLFGDVAKLVGLVYFIVADQHEDVSHVDFCEALYGDVIEEMSNALLEGIVDFFPKRHHAILRKLFRKGHEVAEAMTDKALESLDAINVEALLTSPTSAQES